MFKNLRLQNYKGSFLTAFLLFFFTQPYFVWNNLFQNTYVQFIAAFLMAILFLRNRTFDGFSKYLGLFFVSLILMITFVQGRNFFYLLSILPFAAIPFANVRFTKNTYSNFLNIYCVITALSLFVWILVLVGVVPSLGTVSPINQLKEVPYNHYPMLILSQGSYRFGCVFDEAGVVGTLSGMLLCIQRMDFKDKRNLILLISGLCSMSMFFYVMIGAYGVLYYITEKRSIWKSSLMILAVFVTLYLVQYIPVLNEIIGFRLEWDAENMKFAGDNRTSKALVDYLSSIVGTDEFWFGVNNKSDFWESVSGECNIYITLLMNGVLFCLLYLAFMVLYCLHYKKTWSAFVLFLFVFLTCVYQRPFLFNAYFIFLWTYMARYEKMDEITLNVQ